LVGDEIEMAIEVVFELRFELRHFRILVARGDVDAPRLDAVDERVERRARLRVGLRPAAREETNQFSGLMRSGRAVRGRSEKTDAGTGGAERDLRRHLPRVGDAGG